MRYLLQIWGDERALEGASAEDVATTMKAYNEVTEDLREAGAFLSGDGLQPTATATSVRVRDGETQVTDGPFAETKEQLGGFYLIEAADLDAAIAWAAKIPGAQFGTIEVRPVVDYEA